MQPRSARQNARTHTFNKVTREIRNRSRLRANVIAASNRVPLYIYTYIYVRLYTDTTYRNRTRFRNGTTFDEKASRMKSIAIRTESYTSEAKNVLLRSSLRNINISASLRHETKERERDKRQRKKNKYANLGGRYLISSRTRRNSSAVDFSADVLVDVTTCILLIFRSGERLRLKPADDGSRVRGGKRGSIRSERL